MNFLLLGTLFLLIGSVLSAPKGCVRGSIVATRVHENRGMKEEIRNQLGITVNDDDIIKSFFVINRRFRERFVKIERVAENLGMFFFKYEIFDDRRGPFRQIRRAHWLNLKGCKVQPSLHAPDVDYDY
ncbi:unnamed protein product [Nippostrongylus brasiliensis]|uniref:CHRD domain-containing protein n=1 Tax=Nippostrongylus brasiliensis TaxID=27835 RepID=A0A0N4Y7U3_NIPBR|nr:unnamed protein product [Nippostrongylus brasiliensis]